MNRFKGAANHIQKRYIRDYVNFQIRSLNPKHRPLGSLKVPLLKAPSHLGHFSSRVNRLYNEDKYSALVLNIGGRSYFNFSIYDGHGGDECSTYLSENLSKHIEMWKDDEEKTESLLKNYMKNVGGYWRRWYRNKDQNLAHMREEVDEHDDFSLRLPLSFLQTDYDFFSTHDKSGSTCTSVILYTLKQPEEQSSRINTELYFDPKTVAKLTVAHVGDTKAILVDKTGQAHSLTSNHHPSSPAEANRLRKYTAAFMKDSFGEERFVSLANTRAFGDLMFKQTGITAEPDVSSFVIGDSNEISKLGLKDKTIGKLGGDECFIVLVTDGVTNYLTDQEIADIVMTNVNNRGIDKGNPQFSATEVVKFVEAIGGDDNATCLVIRLNGWGNWPMMDRTGALRQERLSDFAPRGDR